MSLLTKRHGPLWLSCALLACGSGGSGGGGKGGSARHRAQAGDLAFVGATVLPMDKEGALADHTVLVRGDRIALVAPSAEVDTAGATVVEARGKWLLPGLADMHVHLWGERDLPLFVANGVTTVRNLFGAPEHLTWRDRIARGELDGPTLITAGPILDGDPPTWPGSAVVPTPEAARAEVKAQKRAGYDWVKVYNGLSAEVYQAIVEEAKAQGLPVGGHVPRAVGIEKALASGQRSIEHLDGYVPFLGEPKVDGAIVAATAQREVWNCATLIVTERFGRLDRLASLENTRGLEHVAPMVRDMWNPKNDFRLQRFTPEMYQAVRDKNVLRRKLVGDLARAGARLVLGTDTGNPFVIPGYAVHEELGFLVEAGLGRWQALRAATAAAAELAGAAGAFGVVAAGARADLLLVDRDPLADLGALADPPLVVVRGKLLKREQLLASVRAAEQPAAGGDPFAALPALEPEGKPLVTARYEILFGDRPMGQERAVLSTAGGTRVVRGQAVFQEPMKLIFEYRATRDSFDLSSHEIKVSRQGGKVVGVKAGMDPLEVAAAPEAVVAPQTIAEFVWYAESLADLKVGQARTLASVQVRTETGLILEPASFAFTRKPDVAKRRAYDLTGKVGRFDLTGHLLVSPDGAPHEVSVTVPFGTFVTRRTD